MGLPKGEGEMKANRGFTLIELMIVVAIIAVLAAIAFPLYADYVSKAQLGAALSDVRPGKTTFESVAQDSKDATLINAGYIGVRPTERCSAVSAELGASGVGSISCTVHGNSAIESRVLYLRRAADGSWSCDASAFEAKHRPAGC